MEPSTLFKVHCLVSRPIWNYEMLELWNKIITSEGGIGCSNIKEHKELYLVKYYKTYYIVIALCKSK